MPLPPLRLDSIDPNVELDDEHSSEHEFKLGQPPDLFNRITKEGQIEYESPRGELTAREEVKEVARTIKSAEKVGSAETERIETRSSNSF